MSLWENASDMSVQEHVLRYDIAELIYGADWEISGVLNERTKDIVRHCMLDENEVVEAIIVAVRETDRQ